MLPASHRLRRKQDILGTIRTGQKLRSPYLDVYYRPGDRVTRIACVVGKRVHASAVVRHRLQRRMRASAREWIATLPQPYDIVWVAQAELTQLSTSRDLTLHLQSLLKTLT